jgi:hypothetical protein
MAFNVSNMGPAPRNKDDSRNGYGGFEPFADDSAIEQITKTLAQMKSEKGYTFTKCQKIHEEDPMNEDTLQISDNFNQEFGTPEIFNNKFSGQPIQTNNQHQHQPPPQPQSQGSR